MVKQSKLENLYFNILSLISSRGAIWTQIDKKMFCSVYVGVVYEV